MCWEAYDPKRNFDPKEIFQKESIPQLTLVCLKTTLSFAFKKQFLKVVYEQPGTRLEQLQKDPLKVRGIPSNHNCLSHPKVWIYHLEAWQLSDLELQQPPNRYYFYFKFWGQSENLSKNYQTLNQSLEHKDGVDSVQNQHFCETNSRPQGERKFSGLPVAPSR